MLQSMRMEVDGCHVLFSVISLKPDMMDFLLLHGKWQVEITSKRSWKESNVNTSSKAPLRMGQRIAG